MKGQVCPEKSKREIYQLRVGKTIGFIKMDTLAHARAETLETRFFFCCGQHFCLNVQVFENARTPLDFSKDARVHFARKGDP
jgi:hypothetical protein